ncbi:hypothetical protein RS130_03960 [Paraglaciecola aquimarina]|uniref:Lipoprotein n=1 Tax=Paraglaciecola aquimarina TaxID=1235557 RepID=A0ABU3ST83_9ALTE|nr:hypothetical protein [Paraglaciecola aquimarina]MDU0353199.1 hypothetical protein [Paraglaciecola aquimarina]
MFKNLVLAILIAIVLTTCFGHLATEWFDWNMSFANENLEPLSAILVVTGVVVMLVIIGFIVAISLFGAILLGLFAATVGLFIAGISVFWPAILFAIVIYLLVRDKKTPAY